MKTTRGCGWAGLVLTYTLSMVALPAAPASDEFLPSAPAGMEWRLT